MNPCAYSALREAAVRLLQLRLSMQTVIPVALPAESYPASRKNGTTGQRKIQRDKNGKPLPAYVGKNPSFWKADGTPTQASHRKAVDEAERLARIAVTERLGKPIGLAVPSTDVVVIDFNRKNYPSQEACDREWLGLLDLYPELTQTRIERTPGGGVHIYVRPADVMASWRSAAGKLHCQFTPVPGGEHRGEVLAGTRVCVCAPTRNGAGADELVNPDHAYSVVEVPDLASIGIYPEVNATPEPTVPPSSRPASERRAPNGLNTIPPLADLIGSKAQDVLAGGPPYGGDSSAADDRSLQLTGFVKELWSWHNLEQGWRFEGDPRVASKSGQGLQLIAHATRWIPSALAFWARDGGIRAPRAVASDVEAALGRVGRARSLLLNPVRESSYRQGLSRANIRSEPSDPMNRYDYQSDKHCLRNKKIIWKTQPTPWQF